MKQKNEKILPELEMTPAGTWNRPVRPEDCTRVNLAKLILDRHQTWARNRGHPLDFAQEISLLEQQLENFRDCLRLRLCKEKVLHEWAYTLAFMDILQAHVVQIAGPGIPPAILQILEEANPRE